jgi:hypothetical protein
VALEYYKRRSSNSLKLQFLDHGEDGLMDLQIDLIHDITKALASLELYNKYDQKFWEHWRWLNQ